MLRNLTFRNPDRTVPSLGAGLAVADHMLLMLRDLGVTSQAFFALPEYRNGFTPAGGGKSLVTPLWGAVVDMGGATGRRRPSFLALGMINAAVLPPCCARAFPARTRRGTSRSAQTTRSNLRARIRCRYSRLPAARSAA